MNNHLDKFAVDSAVPDEHNAANAGDWLAQLDASCRETGRELERLSVWQKAQQEALKSRFNVFTAMLKHDDEVRLHSRWLHYLLNPEADHDCKTLFLHLFIKTLEMGVQPHENEASLNRLDELMTFATETVTVERELPTRKHGNLDIQIESPKWGVIVIENKTKSGEGAHQISDYADYCTEYCRGRKYILLFLTPDGRQAQTAGTHNGNYYRISYRDHILPWIEECLRATYQFAHINQALQQYKNVVNQLLNRNSDNAYMNEVTEILKKHPAIIAHLADINGAVEILREDYWGRFVPELRKQLRHLGITLGQERWPDKHAAEFELEVLNGFKRTGYQELRTTLEYWKYANCLLIGETVSPPDAETRRGFQKKKGRFEPAIKQLANEFQKSYKKDDDNEGWPLGWAEFLSEFMSPGFLAKHATENSRPMSEQAADVVKVISNYLKILEEAWPDAAS